jgi:uncharacterized protein (TIGR02145 family)
MRTLKLIALALFVLIFSQCKTTSPTAPTGPAPSMLEVVNTLDTTQSTFLNYADSTNGNAWRSILLTTKWLQSQPNILSAYSFDSIHINIVLKSGLHALFYFDQIDADSMSLTRGGGIPKNSKTHLFPLGHKSENTITNKKVLFFIPPFSQFYGDNGARFQTVLDFIQKSGLGLEVTILKGFNAGYSQIETFKDYGLVIIDSHGLQEEFMTGTNFDVFTTKGTTRSEADIKQIFDNKGGLGSYDKCISGLLTVGKSVMINTLIANWQKTLPYNNLVWVNFWATSKYINSLPSMPNTVIFGNMCFSGWGLTSFTYPPGSSTDINGKVIEYPAQTVSYDPIRAAFLNKSPLSYYCYTSDDGSSDFVNDIFALDMEDTLMHGLMTNVDSTGHVYLQWNEQEFPDPKNGDLYLRHFGADNYSYMKCGDTLVDDRDGQKYPTVCIGKQIWMAKNLNYYAPGSVTYNNDPVNGTVYGRLYDFQTMMQGAAPTNAVPSGVQGVCPKGWHIPSDAEFTTLSINLGDSDGGAMKSTSPLWNSPNMAATNSSGFSALPGGYSSDITNPNAFGGIGDLATFATTTPIVGGIGDWSTWGILYNSYSLDGFNEYQKGGVACRCVKDP